MFVECRTRDWKIASSNLGRSGGRIFFSTVNFVCWLLFGVCSFPVLLQWHVKDPGHFAKSAGGRLHLNTHSPLTQWSWSGLTMLLFRQSVRTYPETSSHATCQRTLSHSCLSWLSHCGLILAWRVKLLCMSWSKKKMFLKCRQRMNGRTFSQSPHKQGKPQHTN